MLVFLTTAEHAYTIKAFLQGSRTALTRRVITLSYRELLSWRRLPFGVYVLADVDRLSGADAEAVTQRLDALRHARPGVRVLNDPRRSLGRCALLARLFADGVNDFRAVPLPELNAAGAQALRYPVFLRQSVEHTGALTPPLPDAKALWVAIGALPGRGIDPQGCLVVEFVDVRNAQGLYEKYSALRVGDTLIANDLSVHTDWVCKGEAHEFSSEEWQRRDLDFQHRNPHSAALWPVFQLAGIEYGRVDYAFSGGRLQVFEINTNPYLAPPDDASAADRPSLTLRQAHLVDAFLSLLPNESRGRGSGWVPGARGKDRVDAPTRARRAVRALLRQAGALALEHECWALRERLRHRWNRDARA